jgi:hypothetical protein
MVESSNVKQPASPDATGTKQPLRWVVPIDDGWHMIGAGPVLHVATRIPGAVEVWTLEDSSAPKPPTRTVRVYGTGHTVHPRDAVHHGTVLDGHFVWHLFGGE